MVNKFKLFLTSLFVVGIAACVQPTTPTITPKPIEEKKIEIIMPSPTPTFTPIPKFVLPRESTPTPAVSTIVPVLRPTITPTPTASPTPYRPTPQIRETPPLSTPTSTPENKRKQSKQRRVVFVAGLCSTNPKDTFSELSYWLVQDMGFTNSDFDYYNYSLDGKSGAVYNENDTLKSIDGEGGSAENFQKFLINLSLVYPNAKFNVIGHSLGGVIALYAVNQSPKLHKIIDSVVTINSPIRGEGLLKLNAARVFTCIVPYEIEHKIPTPALVDVKRDSDVISAIMNADYSKLEGRTITLANSNDPVLVSHRYSSGEVGTLDDARFKYIYSFGFGPDSPHTAPLKIISLEKSGKKEAAEFMKRALRYAIKGE